MRIKLPPFIAHRCGAAHAPENTLIAMKIAKEKGAHWIEFDVHLSRDDQAIVMHDLTLERTTNGAGKVRDTYLSAIKALDAGSWYAPPFADERVPTFLEMITLAKMLDLGINVEIKATPATELLTTQIVMRLLNEHWENPNTLLVSSFSDVIEEEVRRLDETVALGYVVYKPDENALASALALDCVSIHAHYEQLTPAFIDLAHQKGLLVCAYTINDASVADTLFQTGVDSIFSDGILRQALV